MTLEWGTCKGDVWCNFWRLILDDDLMEWYGVYIIWEIDITGRRHIRYVGEGIIGERIAAHRADIKFSNVASTAFVTWARVYTGKEFGRAIESYLSKRLKPDIGTIEEYSLELEVNLPW